MQSIISYHVQSYLVPFLLIGASYGRLIGHAIRAITGYHVDPGVYALIGASSFFGGGTRMTISLSIIMLEISNDLQFLPPIMLTVMVSKWIGDLLTHPLYDMLLVQRQIPFLESEPCVEMDKMTARDVMATNIKCLPERCTVKQIVRLLCSCTHNGFPVITPGAELVSRPTSASRHDRNIHDDTPYTKSRRIRIMKGLILRKQLLVIIRERMYLHKATQYDASQWISLMFEKERTIEEISATLSNADLETEIDLTIYMNRSCFTINEHFLATFAFRLFRSMGLRHLPVVSDENDVVGMITRKDLLDNVVEAQFERVVQNKKNY